ncbi:2OG-Fe(II) oxygenase [Leptolyngbya boryana CZ1]|uniref:2OG-Fe(II) oxygenase n=1 Tax=Leptolyngbya boryana CZ1 TaxID=3060204 RepID=A0AA96WQ50_LEPBY|nr:2OG-Fe(II) oxygenase [Leptolyngbya boryana]WNZ43911.1 2OG-Fe(II) oxygenase [Leptolyngbya boryana CZ1]
MKLAARYVQIDNWLSVEEHRHLLNYVSQQQPNFEPADMPFEGAVHRKAWVLFSFPEFSSLVEARIQAIFPDILAQLSLPSFEISQIEAQLTAHNDGNYYKIHTDNGIYHKSFESKVKTRLLTYVYYFHNEPKAFSGGELRLYDSTIVDNLYCYADSFQSIEPRNNRMIFFLSRQFHEVMPVSCSSQAFADSRFTINGWIHGLRPKSSPHRALSVRAGLKIGAPGGEVS